MGTVPFLAGVVHSAFLHRCQNNDSKHLSLLFKTGLALFSIPEQTPKHSDSKHLSLPFKTGLGHSAFLHMQYNTVGGWGGGGGNVRKDNPKTNSSKSGYNDNREFIELFQRLKVLYNLIKEKQAMCKDPLTNQ